MNTPALYHCSACQRGVLNRRVPHCLFCGARLPEMILLTDAQLPRVTESPSRRLQAAPTAEGGSLEAIGAVLDTIDLIGDLSDLF
jgi:hypothetical protein